MKTSIRLTYILLTILAVSGLSSCTKDSNNGIGTAEFSLNLPDGLSQLKSVSTDSVVVTYQLMISVEDMNGHSILSDKLIPLYTFGTGFVSEKLEIRAGEFKLTKFMVINPSGAVVYASPIAGSPLAYLTNKPLPFRFNIFPDKVTQVLPEVLAVAGQTPDKFGYVSFGVQVVKPLTFWAGAVIDNPMIMAPSPLFTAAKLTVWAKDGWHYTFNLFAGVNQIIIRGGSDVYSFILEKEGYLPRKFQFTPSQLLETTRELPLYLKIPWDSYAYKTFVLQPGPEAGKDAMISNLEPDKNFGSHKYFEATFLTEPILTVMRSNRSLIWFDLSQLPQPAIIKKVILRLTYDLPIPWDSTIVVPGTITSTNFIGGVLQQVTAPWEEAKVTWNNKPASSEINQVFIPPFIRNVNFIEVDVTRLFVSPSTTPLPNHGMIFKLIPENKFPGFRFASSDFPEPVMRPKLIVYFTAQ